MDEKILLSAGIPPIIVDGLTKGELSAKDLVGLGFHYVTAKTLLNQASSVDDYQGVGLHHSVSQVLNKTNPNLIKEVNGSDWQKSWINLSNPPHTTGDGSVAYVQAMLESVVGL